MSNSKRSVLALAIGVLVSLPASATAQWSVEGRVGSAMPSGELTQQSGFNQTAGPAFAADATYTFNNTLGAYGGVTRERFNCDGCTRDVSTTGFDGGIKLRFQNSGSATPWVRGGLMLHQPAVDGVSRDWGLGVGSAAGIDWMVGDRVAIVPALRLNSYSSGAMSLTYFTIDAGVHVHM